MDAPLLQLRVVLAVVPDGGAAGVGVAGGLGGLLGYRAGLDGPDGAHQGPAGRRGLQQAGGQVGQASHGHWDEVDGACGGGVASRVGRGWGCQGRRQLVVGGRGARLGPWRGQRHQGPGQGSAGHWGGLLGHQLAGAVLGGQVVGRLGEQHGQARLRLVLVLEGQEGGAGREATGGSGVGQGARVALADLCLHVDAGACHGHASDGSGTCQVEVARGEVLIHGLHLDYRRRGGFHCHAAEGGHGRLGVLLFPYSRAGHEAHERGEVHQLAVHGQVIEGASLFALLAVAAAVAAVEGLGRAGGVAAQLGVTQGLLTFAHRGEGVGGREVHLVRALLLQRHGAEQLIDQTEALLTGQGRQAEERVVRAPLVGADARWHHLLLLYCKIVHRKSLLEDLGRHDRCHVGWVVRGLEAIVGDGGRARVRLRGKQWVWERLCTAILSVVH